MTKNFQDLVARLTRIDLFGKAGEPMPPASALQRAVEDGGLQLPNSYAAAYLAPLEQSLPRLISQLSGDGITLETLTAAVYQHRTGDQNAAPLHRFLAVISDLYRSFLDRDKRSNAGVPLQQTLPPLAMFQNDGQDGPFTLPVDAIQQITGGTVGVVSMPATYASDPFIWAALAHETGGHDVTHADSGLLEELSNQVVTAFTGLATADSMSRDDLVRLWGYWMDEASADVYGLLNVGPMFAPNLAAFFAALNSAATGQATLRMDSAYDQNDPNRVLDPHPTDILRLHLAIGVIDVLAGLSNDTKTAYIQQIEELAAELATADSVRIVGNIPSASNTLQPLQVQIPLAYAQKTARCAGGYIATKQLNALKGHSIQDIETWDDPDEAQALAIKAALIAGRSIQGLGDDAQLLAGATMALLEQPSIYDAVTVALNAGLDRSFQTDPIWGAPPVDAVYVRYGREIRALV